MATFVSVTRLRMRKWRYLPAFLYFTLFSFVQAKRADGNLGAMLKRDARQVYWTITVWRDERAMKAFRNHGSHLKAMPRLRVWCDEATYSHWEQETNAPPGLQAAYAHLTREGIVSRVEYPSPAHATRSFPSPKS